MQGPSYHDVHVEGAANKMSVRKKNRGKKKRWIEKDSLLEGRDSGQGASGGASYVTQGDRTSELYHEVIELGEDIMTYGLADSLLKRGVTFVKDLVYKAPKAAKAVDPRKMKTTFGRVMTRGYGKNIKTPFNLLGP